LRRSVTAVFLLLLLLAFLPFQSAAHAQGTTTIDVNSQYTLNRYGFATINETVMVTNNGTSAIQVPSLTVGFGNISSKIVASNLVGSGFNSTQAGGSFVVSSTQSLQAGANTTFVLSALLNGVVSTARNGSLEVLTLSSPSISTKVDKLTEEVQMPASTSFESPPADLSENLTGSGNVYSAVQNGVTPSAVTSLRSIAQSADQDFNPLHVFSAQRTITTGPDGKPLVTDKVVFENLGTTPLTQLYVSLLAPFGTPVEIVTATATQPVLLMPFSVSLSGGAIDLTSLAVGYPSNGVQANTNFTLTYQYPLGSSYYSVSGGQVSMKIPESAPVSAFVDSYSVGMTLPQGAKAVQGSTASLTGVTPWQTGTAVLAYTLSPGWTIEGGIPLASLVFVLLLIGLFAARAGGTAAETEEAEEEEETSTEQASGMISAFDEKTNLINSLWPEIEARDPNEVDRAYFDELRGRLDQFRNRALQRLNEVKQKAASQRFSEVVGQIQVTEREVDRAAKDKLNLYQQYYLKQMRKEVYDRLLPQYTKRLEKALNQLSDELHTVQRESKLS
jgi:hypothetical protein